MLMEDFSLSPEIILSCRGEIEHHCSGLHRKGRTLHCLMKVVRGEKGNVGLSCQQAVRSFSITSLTVSSAGRGIDLSVNVLPCNGGSAEVSLALLGATECWKQLCNCHAVNLVCSSASVRVVFFLSKNTFWIGVFFWIFCSCSPPALK